MKRLAWLLLSLLVLVAIGSLVLRAHQGSPAEPRGAAAWTESSGRPASTQSDGMDAAAELRRRLSGLPAESAEFRAGHERALAKMLGTERSRWWFVLPLSEIHDELRAAAQQGDSKAAHALGSRLARCNSMLRERTPAALLEELERDIETHSAVDRESQELRMANLRRRITEDLERYEDCASIPFESRNQALAWLEKAGSEGDLAAKLAFVSAWSEQASDRHALIADVERVAAQRELARQWLQQALEAGDESALDRAMAAHSGSGGLYPRSEVQERAFAYAQQLVQGRRTGKFDALWEHGPERYGKTLTAQDWDAIEKQGREIFNAYFAQRPVWPNRSPAR